MTKAYDRAVNSRVVIGNPFLARWISATENHRTCQIVMILGKTFESVSCGLHGRHAQFSFEPNVLTYLDRVSAVLRSAMSIEDILGKINIIVFDQVMELLCIDWKPIREVWAGEKNATHVDEKCVTIRPFQSLR